jgi:hypothetical protein
LTVRKPRKTTAPKPKRKPGRPTKYSEQLADRICSQLASGMSARSVCAADDMPSMQTFWRWLRENQVFRERYAHAKDESADALVEQMLDIADDASGDFIDDGEGNIKFNHEHVQRSRLRVDTRRWIAAKLRPKRYGDRVDMNHGVQPDDPLAALLKSVRGASFGPVPTRAIEREDDEDANS